MHLINSKINIYQTNIDPEIDVTTKDLHKNEIQ